MENFKANFNEEKIIITVPKQFIVFFFSLLINIYSFNLFKYKF